MGVELSQAVPWGRSMAEYVGMFDLGAQDLGKQSLAAQTALRASTQR